MQRSHAPACWPLRPVEEGARRWLHRGPAVLALALSLGCGGLAGSARGEGLDAGAEAMSLSVDDAALDGHSSGRGDGSVDGASAGGPPSCARPGPGRTDCGADGSGTASCCESLAVTGGTYYRTYADGADGGTGEADPATISGFRLDTYLVTVGRFRQFAAAWNDGGGYLPPEGSGKHAHLNGGEGLVSAGARSEDGGVVFESGWDAMGWNNTTDVDPTDANLACTPGYGTWTTTAGSQENLPINCVNWYEAYAFCIWDGAFLPSEAELEYAAAGGSQQREYPWGSTAPGSACPGSGCQYAIHGCYYPNGSRSCTGAMNIAPVGTAALGAGLWGQLDLAGELWEWNLDWSAPYVDPCTDCAYLTATSYRVEHGGNFSGSASVLQPPGRGAYAAGTRSSGNGFRCARTL